MLDAPTTPNTVNYSDNKKRLLLCKQQAKLVSSATQLKRSITQAQAVSIMAKPHGLGTTIKEMVRDTRSQQSAPDSNTPTILRSLGAATAKAIFYDSY